MLHANVARPYAQALFNLAKQEKSENKWLKVLADLKEIVEAEGFSLLINNPKIDGKEQLKLIETILKNDATPEVVSLLNLLSENNRLIILSDIYNIFRELVLEDQKCADAIIESAYDISQTQKDEFEKLLSDKFGKKITAQVKVNADLIAGIKITVDDKVIDGSVKGRLTNLAAQLTK
ncbi:F0F1 ATP synthase subunit delta [Aquella oligotrophica]|uniref:ATP synthase subunit delta n=1 Tax=Aquella oligotrophica TaxID=2067065 RepID=A0A2I7N353_9NEIS|nr:F0F1 ATP synthase subunit delta [Aquella oligotrophica]AUR50884.1 F0F1 ATP synthase subunit delta [Aquella oligotrophica]